MVATCCTMDFQPLMAMAKDIFRKPVQGARQDGAKGLAVGCGTGIAGAGGGHGWKM